MAVIAALLAYAAAVFVFQRVPLNADENSYVFQAHNFAAGKVAQPYPPYPEAFQALMIIACPQAGWLSRYPPGHALFLVPGVLIGDLYLPVAVAAGLTVLLVFLSGTWIGGHRTGLLAAGLLMGSPFFILYHGTLLSHSTALLATAIMLAAYVCWRRNEGWMAPLAAGLAWGWLYNNRSFTALLMALPMALDSLICLYKRPSRRMLTLTACFAGAAALGAVALLLYNAVAVGDPWTMTYLYYTPTQKLGFGIRHYGRIVHTPLRGVSIMVSNLRLLNTWLWGFPGSLALFGILALAGWQRRWSRFLAGAFTTVCLGYVYFWYAGPFEAGPSYYLELLPFLAIGAALGLHKIAQRIPKPVFFAIVTVLIGVNVWFTMRAIRELRAGSMPRREVMDALHSAPANSIVFIDKNEHREAFDGGNDMIMNPRGLHGDVLVATWNPRSNQAVMRWFEDRAPFRLRRDPQGLFLEPMPARLDFVIPAANVTAQTGELASDDMAPGGLMRYAFQDEHGYGLLAAARNIRLYKGRFAVEFHLQAAPADHGAPSVMIEVASDGARDIIDSRTIGRRATWTVERMQIDIDGFKSIEPRALYLGYGSAALALIRVFEIEE